MRRLKARRIDFFLKILAFGIACVVCFIEKKNVVREKGLSIIIIGFVFFIIFK